MKKYILLLFVFLTLPFITSAQENDSTKVKGKFETFFSPDEKLQRAAFESASLIDNPTNVVFQKNTLEVMMQHRFGLIKETNSLAGIYGDDANIRIAVAYSIIDRVAIGFGTTKGARLQDFNLKGAILQQTVSNKMPISVTYYGNFTISALPEDQFNMVQDRYSFFNQIIIARRFNPNISFQIAPSISHVNAAEVGTCNDMIGLAFGGRAKITPGTTIVLDYSQPLTSFDDDNLQPKAGFSLGVEFGTSGHTFQIFATNNQGIVPQYNYMKNQNDFFSGDILIGFNITRNYNF